MGEIARKARPFSMNGCIQRGDSFYGRIFNMNKAGLCKTGLNYMNRASKMGGLSFKKNAT